MSDLQHHRIVELCAELRLSAVPGLYGAAAQGAVAKQASYADFLEETLRAEREARRVRACEMFARVAGFPAVKTLEGFDFGFATGAPRQQILELASLAFIERAENVNAPRCRPWPGGDPAELLRPVCHGSDSGRDPGQGP